MLQKYHGGLLFHRPPQNNRQRRRKQCVFRERPSPLLIYSDRELTAQYRFPRDSTEDITDLIRLVNSSNGCHYRPKLIDQNLWTNSVKRSGRIGP